MKIFTLGPYPHCHDIVPICRAPTSAGRRNAFDESVAWAAPSSLSDAVIHKYDDDSS